MNKVIKEITVYPPTQINSIVYNRDGSLLATAGTGNMCMYEKLYTYTHIYIPTHIVGADGMIRMFDTNGEALYGWPAYTGMVYTHIHTHT